jgi:aspartate/methionine/tyrosine aminotransferase
MQFPPNDIISLIGKAPRYDLGESYGPNLRLVELMSPKEASDFSALILDYATAEGNPQLRQAIAASHGVSADNIVVTIGAIHALFLIAFILCDRGEDEVVTTSPLFPLARNVLDVVSSKPRVLALSFEQGYRIDLAAFRQLLSPRTKLVSLASPQNPSGVIVPTQTLRNVLAIMSEICPSAYLLVDQTYREAAYGSDPIAASATALSPKVITVASLSKCHGAPGLRLGWVVTRDRELRQQLVLGKFNTVISCSAVDEALALRLLAQSERIIAERRRHLAAGLVETENWISRHGDLVEWVRPDAGALCCVRLKPSTYNDAAVAESYRALDRAGIRVANGTWFGEESRIFRLGFGFLALPDLRLALEALGSVLKQTMRAAA